MNTLQKQANRTLLTAAVQRAIFCPYTGKCLDVRKAVLVDATDTGEGCVVMHAEAYDTITELVAQKFPKAEILDGRKLWA